MAAEATLSAQLEAARGLNAAGALPLALNPLP